MKKNILIVQSLLVLPLITSSVASGMEISPETTDKKTELKQTMTNEEIEKLQTAIRENHSPLFAQLRKHFESKPTRIESIPKSEYASSKPITIPMPTITIDLTLSETEIINLPMPLRKPAHENVPTNTPEISNDLSQSVMLPTATKELTFFEQLSYHMSTSHQHLKGMISYLENDQFDVENLKHFEWLYEAVATATVNKDFNSLIKIGTLCHDKYPTAIRILEKEAKPAADLLRSCYSLEVSLANKKLQDKRQEQIQQWNIKTAAYIKAMNELTAAYTQSVEELNGNFNTAVTEETERIKQLRKEVSTFATLNREIRPDMAKLLQTQPIQAPKNIFARTMQESQKRLTALTNTVNEMPTINDFKPKSDKLALQNK